MTARGAVLEVPLASDMAADVAGHATSTSAFASVTVFRRACNAVLEAWGMLESAAPCSIYQTRAWLLPWIDTLGRKAGTKPIFILGRGGDGQPLALLCIGLQRKGPVRLATFLGGKDSNFNMPLVRPGVVATARDWRSVLLQAARQLGADAPDAYLFVNQPYDWAGAPNPLSLLPLQPSPSAAFGTALTPLAEDFFARQLSKDSRKKLRKKEARLAAWGPVTHRMARTGDERTAILDRFFVQKLERFQAQNIVSDFDDPMMRAFIERASMETPAGPGIELHALKAGERIVAVYGGAMHGGRWSGMFNSFDSDPEIAKSSPGDLLLMQVIATQCAAGATHLDLGVGEARYKATFCDDVIPLFDTFIPLTLRGWLFLRLEALALRVKRMIKQNPRLLAGTKWVRRLKA